MNRKRTGTIYSEMTNKGRSSVRYVRGARPVYCFRWIGEISINGKRYRKRSTDRNSVALWLETMRARFADEPITTGAASPKYSRIYRHKECMSPRWEHGFFAKYENALSAGINVALKLTDK